MRGNNDAKATHVSSAFFVALGSPDRMRRDVSAPFCEFPEKTDGVHLDRKKNVPVGLPLPRIDPNLQVGRKAREELVCKCAKCAVAYDANGTQLHTTSPGASVRLQQEAALPRKLRNTYRQRCQRRA